MPRHGASKPVIAPGLARQLHDFPTPRLRFFAQPRIGVNRHGAVHGLQQGQVIDGVAVAPSFKLGPLQMLLLTLSHEPLHFAFSHVQNPKRLASEQAIFHFCFRGNQF